MTVGFKYGDKGDDLSGGSFTNLEVISCFMREVWRVFDEDTALDGVNDFAKRKYIAVDIEFRNSYDSTVYTTLGALLDSYLIRVNDSRHSSWNTVDFVFSAVPEVGRAGQSRVLETRSISLISEDPQ